MTHAPAAHADTLPFQPPAVAASAELSWLLRRAFGPIDAGPAAGDLRVDRVQDLADALDLAPRVAARTSRSLLIAELGRGAAWFAARHAIARRQTEHLQGLAAQVVAAAEAAAVPICFLKGYALLALGRTVPGARPMSDLDVLAPEAGIAALASALRAAGFDQDDELAYFQHLAPLRKGGQGSVELHLRLPGLRLGPELGATWHEIEAAGLLAPLAGAPPGVWLPTRSLLLAHLVAHGLAQHGKGGYPLLRLVADVADLGDALDAPSFRSGPFRWICGSVSWAELKALAELVRNLEKGEVQLAESSPAGTLLRHAVALGVDAAYGRALRVESTLRPRGGRHWLAWLLRITFLTRLQVDRIYGRPRSELGYLALRLLRPFDLLRRLAVHGSRWLAFRFRRGR